ncbi:MAG: hypothetical protein J0H27_04985 [Xanthomonadales bacterium]|nr:hypothetical protein [Xanthomonadales bacterium]ODU94256.1 MAG: hypothetical protein ABT18_03675 [Rhodanobacter sp. SCN 66-43]OJY86862.1 MAG: hypothetical protein BGP23_11810 [Xanthomonadales bacterium 66-474]
MKTLSIACALALGLAMTATAPSVLARQAQPAPATSAQAAAPAAPKLHAALRSLWHGHIVTTREYALAVHAGNRADEKKAADAVVANAKQIADAVAGFYGKPAGEGLLKLLAGHWGGVKALTDATKAGNTAGEQKAMTDLAANATDIAKFLAGANPNWSEGTLQGALMMHVNDHKTQLDEMMSNAPAAEQAKSWTEMQHHMDMIADALSDGIAKQFPSKVD